MLNKTTISALRALIYLARQDGCSCVSPRRIAQDLDESPTYLAKSLRHLVKVGVLRAERGVRGGVRLGRAPSEVTMLAVVEACQGTIAVDFCQSHRMSRTCAFHRAALELHNSMTGVLSRWTLAQLIEQPAGGSACVMLGGPSA